MSREHIEHPLLKKGSIQSRDYQVSMVRTCVDNNTLCVLPTGLGKTNIAVMVAVSRLERFPGSKVLFVAPTKPLVSQHMRSFRKYLNLPDEEFAELNGTVKPDVRRRSYKHTTLVFATPQTARNDLIERRFSMEGFSLLVIDETHHSVGMYAYPYLAKKYLEQATNPRILGLTASPGGDKAKIDEVMKNTGLDVVEIRTEKDDDVSPYVQEKSIEWERVSLPPNFLRIRELLDEAYRKRIETLRKMGYVKGGLVSKKRLLSLQNSLAASIRRGMKKSLIGMTYTNQAIKIDHAIMLLETQGIGPLETYWKKIRGGKTGADRSISSDKSVKKAMFMTNNLFEEGAKHPKMSRLLTIISNQLRENPESKTIIFANYRDTVSDIVKALSNVSSSRPIAFVGQREGMTQKLQEEYLNDFRKGRYNTLVATSIGEEGLDIPSMDIAIFYEPVPSAIRSIQRRGRVGRHSFGRIIVLMAEKTRDEAYYWTAKRKEEGMEKTLRGMQANPSFR
jgi:ERCC4-related helicase